MKTNRLVALLLLLATSILTGAPSKESAATTPILNPSTQQVAEATAVGNEFCPVTGAKIGSMGRPLFVIYKGKSVRLCCKGCLAAFGEKPDHFLELAEKGVASSDHRSETHHHLSGNR